MLVTGPFENRNFRVKWDGKFISGISKVSGLQWSTEVVSVRDGSSTIEQTGPGRMTYQVLALERPLGFDLSFEAWAQEVMGNDSAAGGILKDVAVEIYDAAGQLVVRYMVARCWPRAYEAISTLDAEGSAMVVERLMLEYATFRRDLGVAPPTA